MKLHCRIRSVACLPAVPKTKRPMSHIGLRHCTVALAASPNSSDVLRSLGSMIFGGSKFVRACSAFAALVSDVSTDGRPFGKIMFYTTNE